VIRKIAQVRERLAGIEEQLAAIYDSPMHQLRTSVEEAQAEGRDLLAEMARSLKSQIDDAKKNLAAIREQPATP
jgi:hypothetical protein